MTETVDNRGVASDEDADPARMVSGMKLLPGENPLDKEQLRITLMAEFAPKTAYQRRLAEQLVEYEWEIGRHRRFRDLGILAQYHSRAKTMLNGGRPILSGEENSLTPDDKMLARDLVGSLDADRVAAENDFLDRTCWHPEHVLAMAAGNCPAADAHENRIRDLERRRTLLRKEFGELQSACRTVVEDAEIIEADG